VAEFAKTVARDAGGFEATLAGRPVAVWQALDDALVLLCQPGQAYERADSSFKKILNRAIVERILIRWWTSRPMSKPSLTRSTQP